MPRHIQSLTDTKMDRARSRRLFSLPSTEIPILSVRYSVRLKNQRLISSLSMFFFLGSKDIQQRASDRQRQKDRLHFFYHQPYLSSQTAVKMNTEALTAGKFPTLTAEEKDAGQATAFPARATLITSLTRKRRLQKPAYCSAFF